MLLRSRRIEPRLRSVTRAAWASLGFALLGCGGAVTQFEPVHPAQRPSATYPVAAYDLRVGPSTVGKATVWSEGATDASRGGGDVLDVEMTIHNTTQAPLEVDVANSHVTVTSSDGRTQSLGNASRVGGSRTVAPVSSGRVGLHYALPEGLRAHDVARFEFTWRVASPSGDYSQSTSFVRQRVASSDELNARGLPCTPVYRAAPIDDCIDAPPLPTPIAK
jgi:hypothetical protein